MEEKRTTEKPLEDQQDTGREVAVSLTSVTKRFGEFVAVDDLNLDIREGEFFSLLGPSGCGKTTTLRMIAGFEEPTEGVIAVAGDPVQGVPPYRRPVNTVFQDYALFPHMTVRENVEYGLRVQKVAKAERRTRAQDALDMVRLDEMGDRKPAALSGGQRQRVALARALIMRPKVLLLDEPLGALDLKLRQQMQVELKQIQREVGLTFIYVTHDQEEALTMSDRMAVFRRRADLLDRAPAEVYERPATGFVAGFVGVSNVLQGVAAAAITGDPGAFTVRPEKIVMSETGSETGPNDCAAAGRVSEVVYLGAVTRYRVQLDAGGELVVMQQNLTTSSMEALRVRDQAVRLTWDRSNNRPVEATARAAEGSMEQGEEQG